MRRIFTAGYDKGVRDTEERHLTISAASTAYRAGKRWRVTANNAATDCATARKNLLIKWPRARYGASRLSAKESGCRASSFDLEES
jgi:hypothetical protein